MNGKKKKFLGAVLTAFGLGMIIAGFIPLWGLIGAIALTAAGIYLLTDNGCKKIDWKIKKYTKKGR